MSEPPPLSPSAGDLRRAADLLAAGRAFEARDVAEAAARRDPASVEALHLLALARNRLGEVDAAVAALEAAIRLDPARATLRFALGEVLERSFRFDGAEAAYRAAVELDPGFHPARRGLALRLAGRGAAAEALAVLEAAGAALATEEALADAHAEALAGAGRMEEALAVRRRLAAGARGPVAEHNLAALLGDLGRHAEAAAAARRAQARGLRAPETGLVLARALAALGEAEAAEAAFAGVIRERPLWAEAHRDYAQLLWTTSGEAGRALAPLEAVLARRPEAAGLLLVKSRVLAAAGREREAAETLEGALERSFDPTLALHASRAHLAAGRPGQALRRARDAAARLEPGAADGPLFEAHLALGDAAEALRLAEAMRARDPASRTAVAYLATAARALGDPRYAALYDYARFVRAREMAAPKGWRSLAAYLADLQAALEAAHHARAHPFDQSLRGGSQLSGLLSREEPALAALPAAFGPPIRAYLDELGAGEDPFRAENRGGAAFQGMWSVRLAGAGRHVNHIHPEGWISSAAYVALPPEVAEPGRRGWITFGEPGLAAATPLPAGHAVRPEAGLLVLFPSYMWHGTVPVGGTDPRLTVAFDLRPAEAGSSAA